MNPKDVLDRAYGNVPKEPTPTFFDVNFIPTWRGIKYYWIKLVRKITRA